MALTGKHKVRNERAVRILCVYNIEILVHVMWATYELEHRIHSYFSNIYRPMTTGTVCHVFFFLLCPVGIFEWNETVPFQCKRIEKCLDIDLKLYSCATTFQEILCCTCNNSRKASIKAMAKVNEHERRKLISGISKCCCWILTDSPGNRHFAIGLVKTAKLYNLRHRHSQITVSQQNVCTWMCEKV